jgi:hypothetical protein
MKWIPSFGQLECFKRALKAETTPTRDRLIELPNLSYALLGDESSCDAFVVVGPPSPLTASPRYPDERTEQSAFSARGMAL